MNPFLPSSILVGFLMLSVAPCRAENIVVDQTCALLGNCTEIQVLSSSIDKPPLFANIYVGNGRTPDLELKTDPYGRFWGRIERCEDQITLRIRDVGRLHLEKPLPCVIGEITVELELPEFASAAGTVVAYADLLSDPRFSAIDDSAWTAFLSENDATILAGTSYPELATGYGAVPDAILNASPPEAAFVADRFSRFLAEEGLEDYAIQFRAMSTEAALWSLSSLPQPTVGDLSDETRLNGLLDVNIEFQLDDEVPVTGLGARVIVDFNAQSGVGSVATITEGTIEAMADELLRFDF